MHRFIPRPPATVIPRPISAAVAIVLAVAAFPNYLLSQRQRYAKESWDYSDVADLISAQAAPRDCLLVDNTVGWLPGPVRAVLAARPDAYRPLVDIGRGVPAAKPSGARSR